MIKLFIFDIDGCLNNGKKTYNIDANCISKSFCDKDWSILKRFKARNIKLHAITGDPWNEKILKARNIEYNITRSSPKEDLLKSLLKKYKVSIQETAYLGDDIFDANLLAMVPYAFCPNDAINFDYINHIKRLKSNGGDNILLEIFNYFVENNLIDKIDFTLEMQKIMELDKNEKF